MQQGAVTTDETAEMLQLTVSIWHPNCWTLETTARSGGLLGYGVTTLPNCSHRVGYYTVFGDSKSAVEDVVHAVRSSDRIETVVELAHGPDIATVSRNIVVTISSSGGMREAFRSRGYLHIGPTQHQNGRERRMLITQTDRTTVHRELDEIAAGHDADIALENLIAIGSTSAATDHSSRLDLSVRQREAFIFARDRGYYEYPRRCNAETLAAEFGVSKATFIEHLRKAEEKILTRTTV
ncbi:helix-turn-helix domain-containing protein [Halorubraceae archaeon YAN]|nr:helix-turn-helix domain-containing protein [Halorubraceae archaeon YAN]